MRWRQTPEDTAMCHAKKKNQCNMQCMSQCKLGRHAQRYDPPFLHTHGTHAAPAGLHAHARSFERHYNMMCASARTWCPLDPVSTVLTMMPWAEARYVPIAVVMMRRRWMRSMGVPPRASPSCIFSACREHSNIETVTSSSWCCAV